MNFFFFTFSRLDEQLNKRNKFRKNWDQLKMNFLLILSV